MLILHSILHGVAKRRKLSKFKTGKVFETGKPWYQNLTKKKPKQTLGQYHLEIYMYRL